MIDLRVAVPNRPGSSLELFDALGRANVDIAGCCGDIRPGETWGYLHFLVEDGAAARAAMEAAGVEITSEHVVEVVEVEDRPGALADAARLYSDAGRNIEVIYIDGRGRVVIGTEDMQPQRLGVKVKDARY